MGPLSGGMRAKQVTEVEGASVCVCKRKKRHVVEEIRHLGDSTVIEPHFVNFFCERLQIAGELGNTLGSTCTKNSLVRVMVTMEIGGCRGTAIYT